MGESFAQARLTKEAKERRKIEDLNKSNGALPILASIFIVLLLVGGIVPLASAVVTRRTTTTTSSNTLLTVWSRPEDDQLRNKAVMWMNYLPPWTLRAYGAIVSYELRTDPMFGATSDQVFASENRSEMEKAVKLDPQGVFLASDTIIWHKKWSQFKLKVELEGGLPGQNGYTGVPLMTLVTAGQALFECHIYEKDKAEPKVPQDWNALISSLAYGTNPLNEEILKTIVTDISAFFVCKLRASGQAGIYVVDLYYIGPQRSEYVAENIVVFKVRLDPAATGFSKPIWGMDVQNLCILAWPLADPFRLLGPIVGHWQKWPHLIRKPEHKWLISFPDPMDGYAGCDELTLWQRQLLGYPIPIAPNDAPGP